MACSGLQNQSFIKYAIPIWRQDKKKADIYLTELQQYKQYKIYNPLYKLYKALRKQHMQAANKADICWKAFPTPKLQL